MVRASWSAAKPWETLWQTGSEDVSSYDGRRGMRLPFLYPYGYDPEGNRTDGLRVSPQGKHPLKDVKSTAEKVQYTTKSIAKYMKYVIIQKGDESIEK